MKGRIGADLDGTFTMYDGLARAELDGSLVEVAIYLNAKRLLARAEYLSAANR